MQASVPQVGWLTQAGPAATEQGVPLPTSCRHLCRHLRHCVVCRLGLCRAAKFLPPGCRCSVATRCQHALPLTSRSPSILASRCHAPCSGQQPTTGEEGSQRRHCVLDMCVPAAGSAGPTRASGRGGRQRRRQCIDVHKRWCVSTAPSLPCAAGFIGSAEPTHAPPRQPESLLMCHSCCCPSSKQFRGRPLTFHPSAQEKEHLVQRRPAEAAAADRLMRRLTKQGPPAQPPARPPQLAAAPHIPLLAPAAIPRAAGGTLFTLTTAEVMIVCVPPAPLALQLPPAACALHRALACALACRVCLLCSCDRCAAAWFPTPSQTLRGSAFLFSTHCSGLPPGWLATAEAHIECLCESMGVSGEWLQCLKPALRFGLLAVS